MVSPSPGYHHKKLLLPTVVLLNVTSVLAQTLVGVTVKEAFNLLPIESAKEYEAVQPAVVWMVTFTLKIPAVA